MNGAEEKAEAKRWFEKWNIDSSIRVSFINLKMDLDILYVRDWGPAAVFMEDGDCKLADVDFINSDPFSDRACNDSLVLHMSDKTGLDYKSDNANISIKPLGQQWALELTDSPLLMLEVMF